MNKPENPGRPWGRGATSGELNHRTSYVISCVYKLFLCSNSTSNNQQATLRNMKIFLVLTAVVVVALAAEIKYTTKYDNVDLEEIINNDRLLNTYFKCLADKGTCTPDGKELKSVLPDALTNRCQKCNERQRDGAKKIINHLIEKKPDMWQELKQKYDPTGIYQKQYAEEARKEGVKV